MTPLERYRFLDARYRRVLSIPLEDVTLCVPAFGRN